MEIKRFRYFLAVVHAGTVTGAAERLHVAQPAVSRQLRHLETELGLALFDRIGPRLRLTSAGRQFVAVAEDLVSRADRIDSVAQHMARGGLSHVVVAAAQTTINEVLAPFVATLTRSDPFLSVREVPADQIQTTVREQADLGIAAGPAYDPMLEWRPLTDVPLRAYVAPTHRWATHGRRTITISELVTEELLLLTGEHPARGVLDEAVSKAGLTYTHVTESSNALMCEALAASGFGVGVVTDLPRFGGYPLLIDTAGPTTLRLQLRACWPPHHYAAEALTSFLDRLAEFAATYVHDTAWQTSPNSHRDP
ncbi:LysR family transcriptional regulator [Streptomyces sp. MCA2]|uniref:LysR family transcriptional regulator n=1 Tax=Streptomyces sp. MCA2 TaxID=2944805 RepID=UPI002020726A|nr:LysR family transcriptional regulator [Streptomyces sp. MCA2]MCL7492574.1 LysR family transcriptional regulator [Streptomyces sp. MCA2]